jgi:hypothetical protein
MSTLQYLYTALQLARDRDEIRILRLHEMNSDDVEILGTLTCMSTKGIGNYSKYCVICWAHPRKERKFALLRAAAFVITDNLAAALRVLHAQGQQHQI